jgi:hypothetical protein
MGNKTDFPVKKRIKSAKINGKICANLRENLRYLREMYLSLHSSDLFSILAPAYTTTASEFTISLLNAD